MKAQMIRLFAVVPLTLLGSTVYAGTVTHGIPTSVPLPGVLELLGIGGAVAIAVAIGRRKK